MTDINIATQLLVGDYDDHYNTAIIVSDDSDLTTPVRQIRNRFPNKWLIIAFPAIRRSAELNKAAHGHFVIGADKLRQSLLPNQDYDTQRLCAQAPFPLVLKHMV